MAYEPLFDASNATPYKFEKVGDTLEGYYMGSFDFQGDYGPTKKHIFQTQAGAVVVFGQRNLIQQLPTARVGAMTLITLTGELPNKKKGMHPMNLFGIQQDKKNTIEVTGVDLTPTDAVDEDELSETDDNTDSEPLDETPPARAAAPKRAAVAPDAERQRKVQELLNRGRAKTA